MPISTAGPLRHAARRIPRDDAFYSDVLGFLGNCMIRQHRAEDAARTLRQSLAIKEKGQPDSWATFWVRGLLGEALAGGQLFEEAEPMLLSAQQALAECREYDPGQGSRSDLAGIHRTAGTALRLMGPTGQG